MAIFNSYVKLPEDTQCVYIYIYIHRCVYTYAVGVCANIDSMCICTCLWGVRREYDGTII